MAFAARALIIVAIAATAFAAIDKDEIKSLPGEREERATGSRALSFSLLCSLRRKETVRPLSTVCVRVCVCVCVWSAVHV